jgi:hypothetical protein
MNKQTNLNELDRPNRSLEIVENFTNELKQSSKNQLDLCLKKLNFLCLEFDPYQSEQLRVEEQNIINEFDLMDTIQNPFEFTKTILQMLDNVETEQKKRSH